MGVKMRYKLGYRWVQAKQTGRGKLRQLKDAIRKGIYHVLGMVHLALVTDAGLVIMIFAPVFFGAQLIPSSLSLAFCAAYVVCDLVRLRFLRGATISLGFPLIFLALLADSPFSALVIAVIGSLVSEGLQSKFFSKQRLSWFAVLRRAFFYAGHHAVAGLGALAAYQLVRGCLEPLFHLTAMHIQAILAYIALYSLVSMLLVRPHDVRVRLFLAPGEEPFVRIHCLITLMLLPIPASVFYLCKLPIPDTQKVVFVGGVLPPLFVLLFFLARSFARVEEERERLALRKAISQRLGSPANMAELVEGMLMIMEQLVDYRCGTLYSLVDGKLELYGAKPRKGRVIIRGPSQTGQATEPSKEAETDRSQVKWPTEVEPGAGILDKLAQGFPHTQFFYDGLVQANSLDPYLPQKTALIVFPIREGAYDEEERKSSGLIGLIALARPRRRFTRWDWEQGQALTSESVNVFLSVQRLERAMQEVYQKVADYAEDPERVRQAVRELVHQKVDVSKILAVVSERAFQGNVRAVLRDVVEGRQDDEVALAPDTLTEIYGRVRDETPGMPPLDLNILELLQTVTSSLSLAFSFRYQFPDVERGPAFREFYEFLLVALGANTTSRIAALDSQIVFAVEVIRRRAGREIGPSSLPPEVIDEVENLGKVVRQLESYGQAEDFTDKKSVLGEALDLLVERERAVRERLRDPERFVFLQILSGWRTAITNTLEDLGRGPARLEMALRKNRALPLEEITVELVLRNDGPGVATRVMVQLEPSQDYRALEGQADLGMIAAGKTVEPEFTLRSEGEGPLRLRFRITYNDPERKGKVEEFADLLYLLDPPSCFAEIPNPYTPGLPLRPGNPTFVGRDDIFNFIRQNIPALVQKMILVLIGERRTGKTSILQQLPARLNDPRYVPIFIDGQALGIDPGMESFFLSLMIAIADGLGSAGISITVPTLTELREGPQYVFEQRFLPMVRERAGDRVLLLTIDEFEELGARVSRNRLPPEIFPYLRHLIQHAEQLAFIFAGTHKMEALVGDYWSVLFNIAKYKRVSFLSRAETVRLITEPVQPYDVVYDDLAIDEILRLTACHPYFTQLLCTILVNHCNEMHRSYVTVQGVRDAVGELVETGHAHLKFIWQTSDRETKLALATLAELRERLDQVTTAAVADRLGAYQMRMDPGQVTRAMEGLATRDIVREIPGDPMSYDFTAQLYAHWLRHYRPLGKVVEEVDIEPISAAEEASV